MHTLSRRQFLKMASLAAASSVLAACGGGGDTGGDTETGGGAPAGDQVVLQQWYHEYGEAGCQEAVYRIADEYSKSQDKIKVEVTWTPGDYAAKLNSALAAGTGPDVYESDLNIDKVRNKVTIQA